jgi:hypothetical protein
MTVTLLDQKKNGMKSPLTMEKIQQAIAKLQQQGERISRRNVLAIDYAITHSRWPLLDQEQRYEFDPRRTIAHNIFIDSVIIFSPDS